MKMIQLNDGCWVAADQIEEVKVHPHGVTVRMKNGIGHHLSPGYTETGRDLAKSLVKEINEALKC